MIEVAPTGRLEARFESAGGKTQMTRCFAAAPLKIAKTFAQGDGLGVCVMDCSPGLLAGDWYQFNWHLEEKARVFVTTQGFTRVHPSRENPCRLKQKIHLQRGANLEWFPEPTTLFEGAALRTECEVEMAADATFVGCEIVCAGRVGRGEAFGFHALQSRLRVRREGRLIFVSQTALRPSHFDPTRIGAWRDFTHQGQFLVFSSRAGDGLLPVLREVLGETERVWGGASLSDEAGVVVSLLGRRAWDVQDIAARLRQATREFLRGAASEQTECSHA